MNFRLSKLHLFKKLMLWFAVLMVSLYFLSTCSLISHRSNTSLFGTSWISMTRDKVVFNYNAGFYTSKEAVTNFDFEQKAGWIICKIQDEVKYEFVHIDDERILLLSTNTMFYNEAIL